MMGPHRRLGRLLVSTWTLLALGLVWPSVAHAADPEPLTAESISVTPVTPARLLDSRPTGPTVDGKFTALGVRPAGAVTELTVGGRGGVATSAVAAVLNVTVTEPQADGFVTVWPCGTDRPLASNLNFTTGQTIPNAVITRVGKDAQVCLYSSAATHLVVDVNGFFPSTHGLEPLVPARLFESRPVGGTVDGQSAGVGLRIAGSVTELLVVGRGGVDPNASAVVLNVTVTEPLAGGFVTVWPCGSDRPVASSLNFAVGQTIANAVISRVGADGKVCFYTSASTHLVVDVNGAFPWIAGLLTLVPARLLESRSVGSTIDGEFAGVGLRAAGSVTELVVGQRGGVDPRSHAVVLNLTVTEAQAGGFVTVWACGADRPLASTLNYGAGQTIANLALTKVGVDGKVCLYTSAAVHLVVDVSGFFVAPSIMAQPASAGSTGSTIGRFQFFNDTPDELRIALSGPENYTITLPPSPSSIVYPTSPSTCREDVPTSTIDVQPGSYHLRVGFKRVRPIIANWVVPTGASFQACFFLVRRT